MLTLFPPLLQDHGVNQCLHFILAVLFLLLTVSCKKEEKQNKVIERKSRENHQGGGISVSNYKEGVCNPSAISVLHTEIKHLSE